jgi:hypothetical protein
MVRPLGPVPVQAHLRPEAPVKARSEVKLDPKVEPRAPYLAQQEPMIPEHWVRRSASRPE